MFPTQARACESFEEERFGRLGCQRARSRCGTPREDVKIAAMARIVVIEGIGVVAARTQGCHDRGSRGLLVQRGAALVAGEGAKEGHEAASIVSDEHSTFPGHITQYITPRRGCGLLVLSCCCSKKSVTFSITHRFQRPLIGCRTFSADAKQAFPSPAPLLESRIIDETSES